MNLSEQFNKDVNLYYKFKLGSWKKTKGIKKK